MLLQERFKEDLKEAMRAGDVTRREVIRFLRSDIHNQEISRKIELDDEDVIALLGRHAQQRRDSIEAFQKGGRQDLVEKERMELEIIQQYLPKQLTLEEIESIVQEVISSMQVSGPQDMGKVMGLVMPQIKGKAQGREVGAVVRRILQDF